MSINRELFTRKGVSFDFVNEFVFDRLFKTVCQSNRWNKIGFFDVFADKIGVLREFFDANRTY